MFEHAIFFVTSFIRLLFAIAYTLLTWAAWMAIGFKLIPIVKPHWPDIHPLLTTFILTFIYFAIFYYLTCKPAMWIAGLPYDPLCADDWREIFTGQRTITLEEYLRLQNASEHALPDDSIIEITVDLDLFYDDEPPAAHEPPAPYGLLCPWCGFVSPPTATYCGQGTAYGCAAVFTHTGVYPGGHQ